MDKKKKRHLKIVGSGHFCRLGRVNYPKHTTFFFVLGLIRRKQNLDGLYAVCSYNCKLAFDLFRDKIDNMLHCSIYTKKKISSFKENNPILRKEIKL